MVWHTVITTQIKVNEFEYIGTAIDRRERDGGGKQVATAGSLMPVSISRSLDQNVVSKCCIYWSGNLNIVNDCRLTGRVQTPRNLSESSLKIFHWRKRCVQEVYGTFLKNSMKKKVTSCTMRTRRVKRKQAEEGLSESLSESLSDRLSETLSESLLAGTWIETLLDNKARNIRWACIAEHVIVLRQVSLNRQLVNRF